MIVTDVLLVTANVVIVKLADVCPPGTLTIPGARAAFALLVASVTEIPPVGAGELKNTVPVAFVPLRHAAHAALLDATRGLEYEGSAVILTCDEHDVAAFTSLLDDARPLLRARRRLGVDCVLADACRWLDAGCPVAEGRVVALGGGGRERVPASCLSRTETPASREPTWAGCAAAAEIERRRGCASCPVENTCSRCARPEPFTESQYCSIRRSGTATRLIGAMEMLDATCFAARFSSMLG